MTDQVGNERTLLGYYYQDWLWPSGALSSIKSLLLFFDKMAMAVPERLRLSVIDSDPVLAAPLHEAGLLVNFDPDSVLDANEADALAYSLIDAFNEDLVLRFSKDHGPYATRSSGHFGYGEAAGALLQDLRERGVIRGEGADGTVRMSAEAKLLVLSVFASHLGKRIAAAGDDLCLVAFGKRSCDPRELLGLSMDGQTRSTLAFEAVWSDRTYLA